MRVVLDTNVLLVSIGKNSFYRKIFDALKDGKFTLLVTTEIHLEYFEQLQIRSSTIIAENICRGLTELDSIEAINVSYRWNLITTDPDDNKFTDCAVAGNADYLVTNDAHFNILKTKDFPPINIVSAEEFLQIIQENG